MGRFATEMRRLTGLMAVGTLLALASACSTTSGAKTLDGGDPPAGPMNLDPMLIRANANGDGEAIEVSEVFKLAYKAYSDRRYEQAARHYRLVAKYFPDSDYYMPALYNAGLSYEKLERWPLAADFYRRIVDEYPKDEEATDAYYRLCNAYEKLGDPRKVVDLMTRVLGRHGLSNFDRIEARVRRANAWLALERWKEAEMAFHKLLDINKKAPPTQRLPADSNLIVQAHLGLGRSFHGRVREIQLVLPTERMGDDLERKAKLFTSAQSNYIEALRHHHPKWSVAAGYRIGELYEDFYADIFNAEIPDKLDDEHVALYFDELRKQIRPLMERAVEIYKKNLALSRRLGTSAEDNRWVADTSRKLERLKAFLGDPITQRRAEMLVAHGQKISNPWNPHTMAVDLVDVAVKQAAQTAYDHSAATLESAEGPES